jgi:uncharacterized protein (DUF486 family)
MPPLKPIFDYCERTDPSLFSEPLNALSNAAFFIAAWLLWRNYKKAQQPMNVTLLALITCIGIGSTAFHVSPSRLTMLGDVVPIALFVMFSLYVCMRNLLNLSVAWASVLILLFAVANRLVDLVPAPYRFNGSIGYFPCLASLIFIALALRHRHHPASSHFFKIVGLFIISLTFRSVDFIICQAFPFGTHFLWHLCNGVVIYMIAETIRKHQLMTSNN